MKRFAWLMVMPIVVFIADAPAGAATHRHSTTTTTTTRAAGTSVVPVIPCSLTTGFDSGGPSWIPTQLPANVPPSMKGKLDLYSTGAASVLAPAGWACSALDAADGGRSIDVTPPGQNSDEPPSLAQSIDATFEYTGHGPGMDVVCPYFPPTNPSTYAGCTTSPPAGETVQHLTPDIVLLNDPTGFGGSKYAMTGVLIYPDGSSQPTTSVNVSEERCTLATPKLCPTILGDFQVREFPAETENSGV